MSASNITKHTQELFESRLPCCATLGKAVQVLEKVTPTLNFVDQVMDQVSSTLASVDQVLLKCRATLADLVSVVEKQQDLLKVLSVALLVSIVVNIILGGKVFVTKSGPKKNVAASDRMRRDKKVQFVLHE